MKIYTRAATLRRTIYIYIYIYIYMISAYTILYYVILNFENNNIKYNANIMKIMISDIMICRCLGAGPRGSTGQIQDTS